MAGPSSTDASPPCSNSAPASTPSSPAGQRLPQRRHPRLQLRQVDRIYRRSRSSPKSATSSASPSRPIPAAWWSVSPSPSPSTSTRDPHRGRSLAVGDIYFRQRCLRKVHDLRSRGVTILFVSHSAGDVKASATARCGSTTAVIRDLGATDKVVAQYLAAMVEKDSSYLEHRTQAPRSLRWRWTPSPRPRSSPPSQHRPPLRRRPRRGPRHRHPGPNSENPFRISSAPAKPSSASASAPPNPWHAQRRLHAA
jgi:hypothetical protein